MMSEHDEVHEPRSLGYFEVISSTKDGVLHRVRQFDYCSLTTYGYSIIIL